MKSIELTKKHKEYLSEMCEKLFPEYPYIVIEEFESNEPRVFMFNKDSEKFWKKAAKEEKEKFDWENISLYEADINIHWFEFCMTYLQNRLVFLLKEPIDTWNNVLIGKLHFYFENKTVNHLVDYLYEEFRKLNIK